MKWKNKKVLVTGGNGMIGKELVLQLKELGASVKVVDLFSGDFAPEDSDLTNPISCYKVIQGIDYVFHLVGIKGNPKRTKENPADFMIPMLKFDTNMISACRDSGVKRFLYTSSIAVENPESDKYPAWAKMTAETLIEAMKIQYPNGTKFCVVRPSNVYGKESLDQEHLMVVSKLIKEALETKEIILDIKGKEQIRDIIHAKDVAKGMIKAMEELPENVNLCSGDGVKIEDIATIIANELNIDLVEKDLNLTLGPSKKVMSNPYLKPEVSLEKGIKEIIEWQKNK